MSTMVEESRTVPESITVPLNGWAVRAASYVEERSKLFLALVETQVGDAAALLDEHFPSWHEKVAREIEMHSIHNCILGQVFEKQSRLPWRRDAFSCGYARGYAALRARLGGEDLSTVELAFCARDAKPFWQAEIKRRALC